MIKQHGKQTGHAPLQCERGEVFRLRVTCLECEVDFCTQELVVEKPSSDEAPNGCGASKPRLLDAQKGGVWGPIREITHFNCGGVYDIRLGGCGEGCGEGVCALVQVDDLAPEVELLTNVEGLVSGVGRICFTPGTSIYTLFETEGQEGVCEFSQSLGPVVPFERIAESVEELARQDCSPEHETHFYGRVDPDYALRPPERSPEEIINELGIINSEHGCGHQITQRLIEHLESVSVEWYVKDWDPRYDSRY